MTYSLDLVGMSRLHMGQPVFAGRSRNKTRSDFMSCFALHIAEYERMGRIGSTANYQMAYRMLARYLCGCKLHSEQFTAEWLERYERWLLARDLGTNTIVFHLRYLCAVYNRAVEKGLFSATAGNPFYRRLIKQVATRKRALPRETLGGLGALGDYDYCANLYNRYTADKLNRFDFRGNVGIVLMDFAGAANATMTYGQTYSNMAVYGDDLVKAVIHVNNKWDLRRNE